MFLKTVGVGPKWILLRSRIRKAIQLLSEEDGHLPDLAGVAFESGYYDQAHFTNEFSRMTGTSPLEYWRKQLS